MAEVELYRKYRPSSFRDVVGQDAALKSLADMGKRGELPHVLLFTGPSGCGKTTLARILRMKLDCSDMDFQEINAADFRGIDSIRTIRQQMGAAPIGGKSRVWLLDEVHALSGDAQNSFLKLLEDTPDHVYFFLATTDPQKLKKTIVTRCTEIKCKEISKSDLVKLVRKVAMLEEVELADEVVDRIAEVAEGSGRKALVVLHAVIGLPDADSQLAAVQSADVKGQAIQIARSLFNPKTTWPAMKTLLKSVDEDPESLRWMILSYSTSVMLGNGDAARAALILEEFREPFYDSKKAGLVLACYNVVVG